MLVTKINPKNFIVFRDRYDYAPFPPLYYGHLWVTERSKHYYGAKISYQLYFSKGFLHSGRCRYFVGTKKEWRQFTASIFNKIIRQSKFVTDTYRRADKAKHDLKILVDACLRDKRSFSVSQLIALHKKWIKLYTEFSFWNIPLWFAAADKFGGYVKRMLNRRGVSDLEFQILTTPLVPSYLFKEEKELLKIALAVDYKTKLLSAQSVKVQTDLRKHARRWFWIPFEYLGPDVWQAEDFFKKIFTLADSQSKVRKLLVEKNNYFLKIEKQQNEIISRYKITVKRQRLLKDFQTVTLMQDEKKEICTQAQYILQKMIFSQIGKKLNIQQLECIKFSHTELWRALRGQYKINQDEVGQRKIAAAGIMTAKGYKVIGGEAGLKLYNEFSLQTGAVVSEARGIGASHGSVHGPVKILLSPKEIEKVKTGDIIIANMTTPDYVPAMKKAAAIVTDEGGITCHAAIVSRELGIPCIIGTKIATQVFKDGDLVEVDADKGVVRKIGKIAN